MTSPHSGSCRVIATAQELAGVIPLFFYGICFLCSVFFLGKRPQPISPLFFSWWKA